MNAPTILSSSPDAMETVERYRKLSSSVVYDIMDRLGLPHQALASDIRPLRDDMVVAGPAFTFQGINSPTPDPDSGAKREAMFNEMRGPCVDIRDCSFDTRAAHYGEWNARLGRWKGAVGAVIDGGLRDCKPLIDMNFPVCTRYIVPVQSPKRWGYYRWQQPITMRGALTAHVVVHPGDFVLGDIDGIVIVPKERTFEVLRLSEEFADMEDRARAEFAEAGDDVWSVYKRYPGL